MFSLVRVVNEVKVILNSIGVEVAVEVKLSLLFLVGQAGGSEKNVSDEI